MLIQHLKIERYRRIRSLAFLPARAAKRPPSRSQTRPDFGQWWRDFIRWPSHSATANRVLEVAEREEAYSYDAPSADYTHRDRLRSLEVLLEEYELDDSGLRSLDRIVHGADVADTGGVKCLISTDDPQMFDIDLARDYDAAIPLGLSARLFYEAGLAGARCDGDTEQRLRAIGGPHDWSAVA